MSGSQNKLALPLGTMLQQYQIEAVLGYGGFGIVYRARHQRLGLPVAIKEYLPQSIATREGSTVHPLSDDEHGDFQDGIYRFLDEAKQLVKFDDHPNVVKCRDFFEENGTAYLVMNFEEGEELSSIINVREQMERPLNEQQILSIVLPILSGLGDIHKAKVLHRDIKPANIFIRRATEQPVLIDFGAAKQDFSTQSKSSFIHTPGYSPIEQIEDEGNLGPWTDIYAVGATLWRIIGHAHPPKVENRIVAHSRGQADPLTSAVELGKGQFSRPFLEAIDRSLMLHAQDRFQSAGEFIVALQSSDLPVATISQEPLTIPVARRPTKDPHPPASLVPRIDQPINNNVERAPQPASPASTYTGFNPLVARAGYAMATLLVVGAIVVFLWDNSKSTTAERAKPSQEVVFSKIERMYERSSSVQNNLDVRQGYRVDKKSLEMLAQEAKEKGDNEDYQDTLNMIQRLTSKIQESELGIRHGEADIVNTAFELTKYHKEWGGYIQQLFEEKIKSEEDRGNTNKANLLNGYYLTIKEASSLSDDKAVRDYLTTQLSLEK